MDKPLQLNDMQRKVLRRILRWPIGTPLAGNKMAPYISSARALVRKGLLCEYRTSTFSFTDEGRKVAEVEMQRWKDEMKRMKEGQTHVKA